jgi:hypothetical protein
MVVEEALTAVTGKEVSLRVMLKLLQMVVLQVPSALT